MTQCRFHQENAVLEQGARAEKLNCRALSVSRSLTRGLFLPQVYFDVLHGSLHSVQFCSYNYNSWLH